MVSEKIFKSFPHYKSMETLDHFGPQGLCWQYFIIYAGDHYTLQHTNVLNIKAVGLMVSEIFKVFSQYKSTENLDPLGGASLDPRGLIGRIYVGNL